MTLILHSVKTGIDGFSCFAATAGIAGLPHVKMPHLYICHTHVTSVPHIIGTSVRDPYQERIIEKKGRGRERETTTHLIKFPVFTHASRVTKFRYDYDARISVFLTPR